MKAQWTKMLEIIKLLLVFAALTLLFYGMIIWIVDYWEDRQLDEQPKGKVVTVFEHIGTERDSGEITRHVRDMKDRLLFFYWFGE